jgi:formate hydrogenlyase subunit 6/NADH:ubiquinone oxidoreductase subunit I
LPSCAHGSHKIIFRYNLYHGFIDTQKEDMDTTGNKRNAFLRGLERLALIFERPFTWLGGGPTLNVFYHTGTIAVFLWIVVGVTGLYLSLFYQYGFEAGYHSVAKIESQLLAHVVRAIHRYASGTALIVTILHGIRLFFMNRFRGPRWLAWVSGIVMTFLLWLDGLTGYWLIFDQRAQLITNSLSVLLGKLGFSTAGFNQLVLEADKTDQSWIFSFIIVSIHILLYAGTGLFFWWHISRLSRPRFLPKMYWLIGVGALVLVISAAFPLGMLPMANFNQPAVGPVKLDPFYLFFLPTSLGPGAGWLWIGLIGAFLLAGAIPWLPKKRIEPAKITSEKCTGCEICASDCPYKAITMIPRAGEDSEEKQIASIKSQYCASCGICLGSCDHNAISLGDLSSVSIAQVIDDRLNQRKQSEKKRLLLVVTCERHAAQGARPYLSRTTETKDQQWQVEVIAVPCVGSFLPRLAGNALAKGANEVRIVGCPVEDCAQREGNLWAEERFTRTRLPYLKKSLGDLPISTHWLAPDEFSRALPPKASHGDVHPSAPAELTWRNFIPVFFVVGILIVLQVLATNAWIFKGF